jgi:uncharacterized protein YkwD
MPLAALAAVAVLATGAGAGSTERGLVQCANDARAAKGLERLKVDHTLHAAAHAFARDMVRRRFFDHTDPDGRDPGERIEARGGDFSAWGENIARGYPGAGATCRGWLKSPGHRRNILDPDFTRVGAGYASGGTNGPYFVQDFGRRPGD